MEWPGAKPRVPFTRSRGQISFGIVEYATFLPFVKVLITSWPPSLIQSANSLAVCLFVAFVPTKTCAGFSAGHFHRLFLRPRVMLVHVGKGLTLRELLYKDCELVFDFFIVRQPSSLVCDGVFTLFGRLVKSLEGETRETMIPRRLFISPWYLADSGP